MPSTRNAIQNILTRSTLNQRWWINDPDCLMVRPDSELSLFEVQSLATVIALSGGHLLLSDDLTRLPVERLRIAKKLVPLIGQRPRVVDWFDKASPCLVRLDLKNSTGVWHLLAVFNWSDHKRDFRVSLEDFALQAEIFFVREFWSGDITTIADGLLKLHNIPAHGVRLLALRPDQNREPCYLGGDLHISQGLEVGHWSCTDQNVHLKLTRPGKTEGQIDLHLPHVPSQITVNQEKTDWQVLGEDIIRVKLAFNQIANVTIAYL
jgi:alpha-galactosidase